MDRHPGGASFAAAAAALAFLAAACGGPRRPPPPRPDRDPLALLGGTGGTPAPTLGDLVSTYPLGGEDLRADLLATTPEHSIFLLQSRRGVAANFRRAHRVRLHVLAGSGTCYVDTRSYPAVAGSSFRIEPGLVHRVDAEAAEDFAALAVVEPAVATWDAGRVDVGR